MTPMTCDSKVFSPHDKIHEIHELGTGMIKTVAVQLCRAMTVQARCSIHIGCHVATMLHTCQSLHLHPVLLCS